MVSYLLITILTVAVLFCLTGIRIINQYERGVKMTLGKYTSIMEPGLNFLIPIIQSYETVDIRQRTIDLPPQEVMTKDKVNLKIDGVLFYTVEEPQKALLNVEDVRSQLSAKATSELKEILGNLTMTESLNQREKIANTLSSKLNEAISDGDNNRKDWGIAVRAIQINNIELPQELVRAMAKQAEAEQEREARVTKAKGEFEAAQKFSEASRVFAGNPIALRLRELQTYQEIGTEKNTLMMVVPETMCGMNNNWLLGAGLNEAQKLPPPAPKTSSFKPVAVQKPRNGFFKPTVLETAPVSENEEDEDFEDEDN